MSLYLYYTCECKPNLTVFGVLNEDNLSPKDYFELFVLGNTPVTQCPYCGKEIELKIKEGNKRDV